MWRSCGTSIIADVTAPKKRGSNLKVTNSLVALSSAAVLTVYTAGYLRTRPAAQRFAVESTQRRLQGPSAPAFPSPEAPAGGVTTPQPREEAPRTAPRLAATPAARTLPAATDIATAVPSPSAPLAIPSPEETPVQTEAPPVPAEAPPTLEASTLAIALQPPPPSTPARRAEYRDGTYLGWGSCRHGDIQAAVVIQGGRIASATISQCWTRYSCSWIDALPGQVVERQSTERRLRLRRHAKHQRVLLRRRRGPLQGEVNASVAV